MNRHLSLGELISLSSMLFGLFFGAGNLIFPVSMGQAAGSALWPAVWGFLVTGVGFPLLAVAALGISRCGGVGELSAKVGRGYGIAFSCALYLAIGPLFAAPRCITVPFEVGIVPLLPEKTDAGIALMLFSGAMFAMILFMSLRPAGILSWVGRILNPLLLIMLACLVAVSFLRPMGAIADVSPEPAYASKNFVKGMLEGYHTLDALAGLAFGIVVVRVLQDLGVSAPEAVARNTLLAGFFSCALMGLIYMALTVIGAQSRAVLPLSPNGGQALALISAHYFGRFGAAFLALTVFLACLKTAVGLMVSCAESFAALFPRFLSYRGWTLLFCTVTLAVANLGLNRIISISLPVLLTLYPLSISLILLALADGIKPLSRRFWRVVTAFTLVGAVLDTLGTLPAALVAQWRLDSLVAFARTEIPLYASGLGWLSFALPGIVIAALLSCIDRTKA